MYTCTCGKGSITFAFLKVLLSFLEQTWQVYHHSITCKVKRFLPLFRTHMPLCHVRCFLFLHYYNTTKKPVTQMRK